MELLNKIQSWAELAPHELGYKDGEVILRGIGYSFHSDFLDRDIELWFQLISYIEYCIVNRNWSIYIRSASLDEGDRSLQVTISESLESDLSDLFATSLNTIDGNDYLLDRLGITLNCYVKLLKGVSKNEH